MKKERLNSSRRRFIGAAAKVSAGLAVAGTGVGFYLKPNDAGGAYSEYFADLNQSLRDAGIGRPCIILDLDLVDHNISRVKHWLPSSIQYRVVTKSLPSLELIRYVLEKSNSRRVMAFHQPYFELFCERFKEADILLGKPMLISAAEEFYNTIPEAETNKTTRQIQWLVDTEERLHHYLQMAKTRDLKLRINLEIDIGLHRGGIPSHSHLNRLLHLIASNPDNFQFTGFMGYEAHVRHAPPVIASVEGAFKSAIESYQNFYETGKNEFPALFENDLTFNSGGSTTYQLFQNIPTINDIAAGSCMVKPSTFGMLEDHKPALFIAAPVLKKLDGPQVPFMEFAEELVRWWNPNWNNAVYLYGGGWAAEQVAPKGVQMNPLTASPLNQNLLPNQSLFNCSNKVPIDIGDFVFFHPQQGDAASQFDEIIVTRGSKLIDTWKPFPKRF